MQLYIMNYESDKCPERIILPMQERTSLSPIPSLSLSVRHYMIFSPEINKHNLERAETYIGAYANECKSVFTLHNIVR